MYIAQRDIQLSSVNPIKYKVERATTLSQQELGLSDRPCLPHDGVLLFLFPTDDKFGIWMKNMRFAIDVVWLDKDQKVVSIEKNMLPETYPKVFYPISDSRYVLEFNSGDADKLGLTAGQTLHW